MFTFDPWNAKTSRTPEAGLRTRGEFTGAADVARRVRRLCAEMFSTPPTQPHPRSSSRAYHLGVDCGDHYGLAVATEAVSQHRGHHGVAVRNMLPEESHDIKFEVGSIRLVQRNDREHVCTACSTGALRYSSKGGRNDGESTFSCASVPDEVARGSNLISRVKLHIAVRRYRQFHGTTAWKNGRNF